MATDQRIYIVAYDIGDPKRWRSIFETMKGYGEWLQLSVFQCRLTRVRHAEMIADLDALIHHGADHVLIMDLGHADAVELRVTSLGKDFTPVADDDVVVI